MRSSKVTPIRGVKIQTQFRGRLISPRTYHKATIAAQVWADNVARNIAEKCTNPTFNTQSFVQFVWDSAQYQSAYDRAYRRSLKIFKQILL